MNFSFYIARRYLFGKKSQNAINIISLISVLGVATGTMALVVVLSVFNGFDKVVKSLFSAFDPDIKISLAEGKTFSPDSALILQIRELDGVEALSEVLEENALLMYGEKQYIATIKGVDDAFMDVSGIDSMIYDGTMKLHDENRPYAIVGQGVAYNLQISLNFINPLFIYLPKRVGPVNLANPDDAFKRKFIFPSGIFSIEQEFDSKYVLVPASFLRELLDYSNEVSSIEVKVSSPQLLASTVKAIREIMGPDYSVRDRQEQNELFYRIMKTEKWAIFLILTFILIVASFNIIGSLSMLIIDKKEDISTLRNMGASDQQISRIFLVEGWMISIIGSLAGLLFGSLICWIQMRFELLKLSGSGTFVIDAYPVDLQALDILLIWLTVLLIGFLAARYPARQISKKYLGQTTPENNLTIS
ncbi:MAG: FtsX-like permease family protein [Bacteroidota bacterium]